MRIAPIRDRERIESFLRRNGAAHIYALADLDEPFWDDARWFCAETAGQIEAVVLLLDGLALPILYAVCPRSHPPSRVLLEATRESLPKRFFYNLGPGLAAEVLRDWKLAPEGTYWKMILRDRQACDAVSAAGVEALGPQDLDELQTFLKRDAYLPEETGGLFFEPQMLESGCYRGIREAGRLAAVGGVHVHSRRFGVAGIGNVVTRPDARGRGLAKQVSAAVVRALRDDVTEIGLNVHEQNVPARRCYESLGFEPVCPYEEGTASRRDCAS